MSIIYKAVSNLQRHAKVTGSRPVRTRFSYNSQQRKAFRRRHEVIPQYVQDHHVIPKQWKNHSSVLRFGLDINSSDNLIFMPTAYGKYKFNIRPERYTHDGGHYKYNIYIQEMLNSMDGIECDKCFRGEFTYFIFFLKRTLRWGDNIVPWQ